MRMGHSHHLLHAQLFDEIEFSDDGSVCMIAQIYVTNVFDFLLE